MGVVAFGHGKMTASHKKSEVIYSTHTLRGWGVNSLLREDQKRPSPPEPSRSILMLVLHFIQKSTSLHYRRFFIEQIKWENGIKWPNMAE